MPNLMSKIALAAAFALPLLAHATELTPRQQAFREIYKELVEINTTDSTGDTRARRAGDGGAAQGRRLSGRRFHVISPAPRKGNLVARLRGTGARKPILLLAHIDVVEAKREDWDFDPFKLQEADGYFRGRGIDRRQGDGVDLRRQPDRLRAGRLSGPTATSSSRSPPTRSCRDSPHDGAALAASSTIAT